MTDSITDLSRESLVEDLPLVHPIYLRMLLAASKAEGVDSTVWLDPLSMHADALAGCEAPIPIALWRRLMLSLQRTVSRPAIAMRLGARVPLMAHGPLAYLMSSSSSLHHALEALVRFAPLRMSVLIYQLRERESDLELHVRPRVALGDVERFTLDFLLGMLCASLEELSPGVCQKATLYMDRGQGQTTRHWAELGIRVERRAGWPYLLFPKSLALAPLISASPQEYLRAWRACEDAERDQGWASSISSRIEQLFRTGGHANYQLTEIARQLGISDRTVIRRLAQEGTRFSELVDTSRKERLQRRLAERQLLQGERQLSLVEIAEDLGFSDVAVLSRAVRRWFGTTPRGLQKQLAVDLELHPKAFPNVSSKAKNMALKAIKKRGAQP